MHPFEDLKVPDNGVGIHWFGQSTFALKHPDGSIYQIDPYYPRERPAEQFIHTRPPLHEASLKTDGILLTHNHGDHTCIESISRINESYPDVVFVGPSESLDAVRGIGIDADRLFEVTGGDVVSIGSITVRTVWAKPPNGLPEDNIDPPDVQHLGFVVEVGQVRVYISGDPVNTFADHPELLEPIRRLNPHIGMLTNHPNEGEFPYFEGSAKIAAALELDAAVPAHYDCFVTRNYDPEEWAEHLPESGPEPLIIPYNQSVVYTVS